MATVIVAPRSHKSKELRRHTLIYLGLMPFLVLAVFPILWMAITAIKQDADLYLVDAVPFWFRQAPTWKNFDFLFHNTSYGDWIVNTMLISFWVSVITLLTAVPAGYALARLRLPFAENLGIGIFMTYLVPAIILFIPLARVVSDARLAGQLVVARDRLSHLHHPVLYLAPHGILQDRAVRDRGGGHGGRLRPARRAAPRRPAGELAGTHHGDDLLLHPLDAGLPVLERVKGEDGRESRPAHTDSSRHRLRRASMRSQVWG